MRLYTDARLYPKWDPYRVVHIKYFTLYKEKEINLDLKYVLFSKIYLFAGKIFQVIVKSLPIKILLLTLQLIIHK